MLVPCPATQGARLGAEGALLASCPHPQREQGQSSASAHLSHCSDGSASDDASRGSRGTKGIPGSREVGYQCCGGSQVRAVTGMPFLMTSLLAGNCSQTWHGMGCHGSWAHGSPGHEWDHAPPPAPQHCWDTTGTSQPCSLMAQPHWNQQHVVRIRPAPGTVPGAQQPPHMVQSFGQSEQVAEDT